MIKEEWRPLKESSNYLVSNTGKIKSLNVNKKDGENVNAKKVICLTTNEVFNSLTEASNKYNISVGNISACCKGKSKSAKGFVWKYWKDSDVDE